MADAKQSSGYISAVQNLRDWQVGNFGENSCPALINTPTYFDVDPELPVQIWTSDCKGNFTLNTQNVITGTIPTVGNANAIMVGDFNKTGVDSIMVADEGLELNDCSANPGCSGHDNELLLNSGGNLASIPTIPRSNHGLATLVAGRLT